MFRSMSIWQTFWVLGLSLLLPIVSQACPTQDRYIQDLLGSPELSELMSVDPDLINAWKKLDELGADDAIRQNPGAIRALNLPKNQRPDPSNYLAEQTSV